MFFLDEILPAVSRWTARIDGIDGGLGGGENHASGRAPRAPFRRQGGTALERQVALADVRAVPVRIRSAGSGGGER